MPHVRLVAKPSFAAERSRRAGEPITFGVPMPRGRVAADARWTIADAGGVRRSVQTRALDRWIDGSVRWLLVDAIVDTDGAATPLTLAQTASDEDARPTDERAILISTANADVRVDTGAAIFVFRVGGRFPFNSVVEGGTDVIDPNLTGLTIQDREGRELPVVVTSATVSEGGPRRARVLVSGEVRGAPERFLSVTGTVDVYAGSSVARITIRVTNPRAAAHTGGFWDLGDPASIYVRDITISFGLAATEIASVIRCSPEVGLPMADVTGPFELYQDSSGGENWNSTAHLNRDRRVMNSFRGYRIRSGDRRMDGLRATPVVQLANRGQSLALTVPAFWQNFPKAVEADGASLRLRLFPQQYADIHEIQPGEQKTHEVFVAFGTDPVTSEPLEWCRAPTVVTVDCDFATSSRAVPFLADTTPAHRILFEAAIEGSQSFEAKRDVVDEYGWRHFGDIYGDHEAIRHKGPGVLVSHYNNQFDPVFGFANQFLLTGDVRWRRMMCELARHVVDIDVYHTDRDKSAYNHGLFWHTYHYGDADTSTHRTYPRSAAGKTHGGGPSADHNYTTGLMHYYFLTGDEEARMTVIDLGQFVIDMDDGTKTPFRWFSTSDTGRAALSAPGYYGPGRAPANSLVALIDAHRLSGDARFINKAERLIRRVIHPAEDISQRKLDVPEQRWFYTMFLQSLGKYLNYKIERGEIDRMYAYARASLLHYARWMADHEHPYFDRPERLEFKTEAWPAQDIRKSDVFYFAALHAANDERPRFLERARFFFDYSVGFLTTAPTRALARPVVILLTSGFMHGFVNRFPEAMAPAASTGDDFGMPERFVPQRVIAKQHAIAAAVAATVAGGSALLWLLLR